MWVFKNFFYQTFYHGYWKDMVWNIFAVLFEFEHTLTIFFTSQRGYLLNTTLNVPGVGFSVAGLDRAKFGFYRFQIFLFIVVIVISMKNCILTNFDS